MANHVPTLEKLEASKLTLSEAAAAMGTSETRTRELLEVYQVTRDTVAAQRARLLRRVLAAAAVVGAAAVAPSLISPAWAQACAQTLPSPMVTLCPDAPARAGNVNGNFQAGVNFLTRKVGPVSDPNIVSDAGVTAVTLTSTGGMQAGGTLVSVGAFTAQQSATVQQNATVQGQLTVNGNFNATGNSWNSGPTRVADQNRGPCGATATTSRCPAGKFVCGIYFQHACAANWWEENVAVECCDL